MYEKILFLTLYHYFRSYVFGSIGPTGSLLGNEELLRFFPDNQLTIFVGTWNMNGQVSSCNSIVISVVFKFIICMQPEYKLIRIPFEIRENLYW